MLRRSVYDFLARHNVANRFRIVTIGEREMYEIKATKANQSRNI